MTTSPLPVELIQLLAASIHDPVSPGRASQLLAKATDPVGSLPNLTDVSTRINALASRYRVTIGGDDVLGDVLNETLRLLVKHSETEGPQDALKVGLVVYPSNSARQGANEYDHSPRCCQIISTCYWNSRRPQARPRSTLPTTSRSSDCILFVW